MLICLRRDGSKRRVIEGYLWFLPFRRDLFFGFGFGVFCLWWVCCCCSFGRVAFGFCLPGALAFPCFLIGLLASPLCGAAPTFLCLPQRKVGKRKRLTPLAHKRVPWLGGGSGASGICVLAHSALVTKPSYFRRRCARRRAFHRTSCCVFAILPRSVCGTSRFRSCLRIRLRAEAKPMAPTKRKRSPRFPRQTHPRRTQCGVGADEPLVTNGECAGARIPDAPLPWLRGGPA
ncbi:hypothetical protein B0G76_6847 [Paraburkholderia sp. BL23I1N1]|nr:hypothetical protein B0G76_6847 [Paraburkholderia sp. BL23I1N1]